MNSAALWNSYKKENLDQLKVAYNRVFRIFMNLGSRICMSAAFISNGLDPFKVHLRKSMRSFRDRIVNSENSLVQAIVNSNYTSVLAVYTLNGIGIILPLERKSKCFSLFYSFCFYPFNHGVMSFYGLLAYYFSCFLFISFFTTCYMEKSESIWIKQIFARQGSQKCCFIHISGPLSTKVVAGKIS